jgi:esterase/lipase
MKITQNVRDYSKKLSEQQNLSDEEIQAGMDAMSDEYNKQGRQLYKEL